MTEQGHAILVHLPRSSFPTGEAAEAAVNTCITDMCKALGVLGPQTQVEPRQTRPALALATTRELLEELTARIDANYCMGEDGARHSNLDFRPVESVSMTSVLA